MVWFCAYRDWALDVFTEVQMSFPNMKLIKDNKEFFSKDLEKNIYFYNKNHLINLNILNFVIRSNIKFNDFAENLKKYFF